MSAPALLLLSSSRTHGTGYLEHARDWIAAHFTGIRAALFVPYAGVTIGWDAYTDNVRQALAPLDIAVTGIHTTADPVAAVQAASAIIVGGGNTFQLLHELYRHALVTPIRARVMAGLPYLGWSAGSNVACPTICTTNDMPIVEPPSFAALNLFPYQINPHFTDAAPPGHMGETRSQRITEFLAANPTATVLGLPEGGALWLRGTTLELLGKRPWLFRAGAETREIQAAEELAFLFQV